MGLEHRQCNVKHMGTESRFGLTSPLLRSLLLWLISIELALAAVFVISKFPAMPVTLVELFDFDREAALPAWFSATQLSTIGFTFLLWAFVQESRAALSRKVLILLGACFVFLSADEAAMVHERLTPLLLQNAAWMPRVSGDRNLWIPLYLAGICTLLLRFRRDFWQFGLLFPRQTKVFCFGAALVVFGAAGLEIIRYHLAIEQMASHWPSTIQILIEELLEMLGCSLILYSVMSMAGSALVITPNMKANGAIDGQAS